MLRLIQVGLGLWSKSWLDAIAASDQVELVAIVEIDPNRVSRAMRLSELDPTMIFSNLEEALEQVEADGMLNLTPPAAHETIILRALESGLPVLTEKPLADTLEAAERIVAQSNQTDILVMVAQNYRYKHHMQTIKHVLDSGDLGNLDSIQIEFWKSLLLTGFHAKLAHPLLIDMSIHHFDLLRFFLEAEPSKIYARSWNPTWSTFPGDASTSVALEFPSGVQASYDASWSATGEITDWDGKWRFNCEKGVLILQDERITFDRRTDDTRDLGGHFGYASQGIEPIPVLELTMEPQVYLLDEFVRGVCGSWQPKTTCQDNIRSMKIVFDVIESAGTGEVLYRT